LSKKSQFGSLLYARLQKNISGQTIGRICSALGVQPGEIMEYVEERE
jgi:DNA-binding Xre family transcriptional regulator